MRRRARGVREGRRLLASRHRSFGRHRLVGDGGHGCQRVRRQERARCASSRPYSTGHSIDDALTLAENLGIESHTVSICEPFEAFEQVIRKSYKEKLEGLASENTRPAAAW